MLDIYFLNFIAFCLVRFGIIHYFIILFKICFAYSDICSTKINYLIIINNND